MSYEKFLRIRVDTADQLHQLKYEKKLQELCKVRTGVIVIQT